MRPPERTACSHRKAADEVPDLRRLLSVVSAGQHGEANRLQSFPAVLPWQIFRNRHLNVLPDLVAPVSCPLRDKPTGANSLEGAIHLPIHIGHHRLMQSFLASFQGQHAITRLSLNAKP